MSQAHKLDGLPQVVDIESNFSGIIGRRFVAAVQQLPPEKVLQFAVDGDCNHICQKDGLNYDSEVQSSQELLCAPEKFFSHPAASILSPDQIEQSSEAKLLKVNLPFNSSKQKNEILTEVNKYLVKQVPSQILHDDIRAVADELFTNALFNAPFANSESSEGPALSRKDNEINLARGVNARIFLAHDQSRIVVGCHDPFGSLNVNKYLNKIRATYAKGPAAAINFGAGGAGIGSYIIFEAGASLYFGVWPGRSTLLCCVIPLGLNQRKRGQLSKHLHLIRP